MTSELAFEFVMGKRVAFLSSYNDSIESREFSITSSLNYSSF